MYKKHEQGDSQVEIISSRALKYMYIVRVTIYTTQ